MLAQLFEHFLLQGSHVDQSREITFEWSFCYTVLLYCDFDTDQEVAPARAELGVRMPVDRRPIITKQFYAKKRGENFLLTD